jgi:hypothetical protein
MEEREDLLFGPGHHTRQNVQNVNIEFIQRQEKEERDRLAAEQARLAREAEEERLRQEKQRQEEERMARIQAGVSFLLFLKTILSVL